MIRRRTFFAGGAVGALSTIMSARAATRPKARFFMIVSGSADGPGAQSWGALAGELEKRGFPTTLVPTIYPNASFTPNATRAAAVVAALEAANEPAVVLGVSNEGNVLPLIAAAHPVRRLVFLNACIPQPGRAFVEVCNAEPVVVPGGFLDNLLKGAQPVTEAFLKLRADPHAGDAQWQAFRDQVQASPSASSMKGFYEVCRLTEFPRVDCVDVSGAADDQIHPAWEQATARRTFKAEPFIVAGAGHANLVTDYASQVADAAVRGL